MKTLLLSILPVLCFGQAVTVTPGTTFQTHSSFSYAPFIRPKSSGGSCAAPNGIPDCDTLWSTTKAAYFTQLVGKLGIDTYEIYVDNTVNYNGISPVTLLNNDWISFSAAVTAAGRTPRLRIVLLEGYVSAAAYAAYALNVFNTLAAGGYAITDLDFINEPDVNSWTTANVSGAATSTIAALNAAGYRPTVECCSTNAPAQALTYYNAVKAVVGVGAGGLNVLSSHNYGSGSSNATTWASIATQAASDGIPVWMGEYYAAKVSDIMVLEQSGNISGFMRGLGARSFVSAFPLAEDACAYMSITAEGSAYAAIYTFGTGIGVAGLYNCNATEPTYFQTQIYQYIKQGAVRESASITGGANWNVIAYNNGGGHSSVIVQELTTGTNTVTVTGIPAGTYSCTWTYDTLHVNVPCSTASQTILTSGTLSDTETVNVKLQNSPTVATFTFFN